MDLEQTTQESEALYQCRGLKGRIAEATHSCASSYNLPRKDLEEGKIHEVTLVLT